MVSSLTGVQGVCFPGEMETRMPHLADHDHAATDAAPGELPDHNLTGRGPCFTCWCYSCGGRTDRPRIEHDPEVETHHGDPSHRWCFE